MTRSKEGFSEQALAASADQALDQIAEARDAAEALIQAWVDRGNAAAVAEVADRGTAGTRKAARRGLNVLKSRGVTVPERKRVASLAGEKQPQVVEAWMLAPDAAGNLMLVISSHVPSSRYHAVFVVLHDAVGVHRIEAAEVSQSQLKESMARALPGAHYKPTAVPVQWVRWRIAEARKRHAERGVPEPLGFANAAALLSPVPSEPVQHPFDDEGLELSDEDARELGMTSIPLHGLPEFRGWFPPKGAVDEMLQKLGESLTPGAQPEPEVLREQLEAQICSAADRYFTPERREELVRAMKDSALSVLARDGEQRALEVVAAIGCIKNRGLITDPPHEVGFLRGFFDKAVTLLLAQGGGNLRIPIPARPGSEPAGQDLTST